MTEQKPTPPPVRGDWRSPLSMGLGIGLGIGTARGLESVLEPSLGYWGAFGISLIAAAVIGGGVAWLIFALFKPRGS